MKYFHLSVLTLLFLAACQKEPLEDIQPPDEPITEVEPIRLKSFNYKYTENGQIYYDDSTVVSVEDSIRQIKLTTYDRVYSDDVIETYKYNAKYQLMEYERTEAYPLLFNITKMIFTRDASGRPIKCYSEYFVDPNNPSPSSSEGTFSYRESGDTTFIQFEDSLAKNQSFFDCEDFYEVAIVNGKVVSCLYPGFAGRTTYIDSFQYAANGNLTKYVYADLDGLGIHDVSTYTRGNTAATELQKFMKRLMGDMFWFSRYKLFSPDYLLIGEEYLKGNIIASMNDYYGSRPFQTSYDSEGNVTRVQFSPYPDEEEIDTFEYWPK